MFFIVGRKTYMDTINLLTDYNVNFLQRNLFNDIEESRYYENNINFMSVQKFQVGDRVVNRYDDQGASSRLRIGTRGVVQNVIQSISALGGYFYMVKFEDRLYNLQMLTEDLALCRD